MDDHARSPGATKAIAYHNHEADQAQAKAVHFLEIYNRAMNRLQAAIQTGDLNSAVQADSNADAAWRMMNELLLLSSQHRNSAVIAANLAAEINRGAMP